MKVSAPFRRLASPLFWSLLVAPELACGTQNSAENPASAGAAGQIGTAQGGGSGGVAPAVGGGAPATGGAIATGGVATGGAVASGGLPAGVGGSATAGGGAIANGGAIASGGVAGSQGRGGQASAGMGGGTAAAGSGNAGGRSGGAGGASGGAGRPSAGNGGASAGASGAGGAGGANPVCKMVSSEYATELGKQLACNSSASGQCKDRVAAAPGCECLVFIQPTDPFAIEGLSNIADGWFRADCSMPSCPAKCTTASTGTCQAGRCVTP